LFSTTNTCNKEINKNDKLNRQTKGTIERDELKGCNKRITERDESKE
jgi:hypothetical protein